MQSGMEELCQQVAGVRIGEEEEEDCNATRKESGTNQAQIIDD